MTENAKISKQQLEKIPEEIVLPSRMYFKQQTRNKFIERNYATHNTETPSIIKSREPNSSKYRISCIFPIRKINH